jgi:hypothetical protein
VSAVRRLPGHRLIVWDEPEPGHRGLDAGTGGFRDALGPVQHIGHRGDGEFRKLRDIRDPRDWPPSSGRSPRRAAETPEHVLVAVEAPRGARLLERDPAAQVHLDGPGGVAALLEGLRTLGADEQIARLLERDPAAQVRLDDDPPGVGSLLDTLRILGARLQHERLLAHYRVHRTLNTRQATAAEVVGRGVASRNDERAFAALSQVAQSLWQSADGVAQLHELLMGIEVLGLRDHRQCLRLADNLIATMEAVWHALSDFRGADLRELETEPRLEDLDGVRWSNDAAASSATQWPTTLRDLVIQHSIADDGPETGVFVLRFGVAVGPAGPTA